jgi:hypothetical protein
MPGERPDEPTGDAHNGEATRGSVEVGSTLDHVNVEVAGGPDIPRCVIPGVAGNFNKVSTMSVVTFSLLSSNRSQHRICRAGLACAMAIAVIDQRTVVKRNQTMACSSSQCRLGSNWCVDPDGGGV